MIISVYNEIIPENVVEAQRMVFEEFGETITQIKPNEWAGHSIALDNHLKNNEWEYVIVFDIDCIPLKKNTVNEAREWVNNNIGLYSVAQNPNHIQGALDYASPAFIAFSRKTYEELGEPSFSAGIGWDVGGEYTHAALSRNIQIKLMYPSNVEIPKWKLKDGSIFGIGTTYDDKIYHHFESRKSTELFVAKCKTCYDK
jgi:hypothetical protein